MISVKGQTLTVNTLIIVALGILVLIISVLMYNKYIGQSEETLDSCTNQLGTCEYSTDGRCPDGRPRVPTGSCEDSDSICCLKV